MNLGSVKKKLLIALSGTALAQVIHLLFTPVLTRIYSPEEFGKLALLIALGGVATAIATAKYDIAIVTAQEDERVALDRGIQKIAKLFAIFLFVLSVTFFMVNLQDFAILSFFIALIAYFRGIYQSKRSILNSYGQYSCMAKGRIIENSSNGLIAFGLSLFNTSAIGLMVAKTLSYVIPAGYYNHNTKKHVPQNVTLSTEATLKKFIKFPKYSIASELLTQINLGFSIFAFTYLYGEAVAGHISMTTRVLSLPINFIGLAFLDVFREKATKDYLESGNFRTIFLKFFFALFAMGLAGFGIVFFWGESLFTFALGQQWQTAGTFATIAIFLYSIRLVSSPLGFAFHLNHAQRAEMLFKVLILLVSVGAIVIAKVKALDAIPCLQIYCFSLAAVHALYIFAAYKNSYKA